jgi:hypothetical protein
MKKWLVLISLVLFMPGIPTIATISNATSSPSSFTISNSVLLHSTTWTHIITGQLNGLDYTITLILHSSRLMNDGIRPLCSSCTIDGLQNMVWTEPNNGNKLAMNTTAILELNINSQGVITGNGDCSSLWQGKPCSGGKVANGYALCSGPTNLLSQNGGTIGYSMEQMGGASGFLYDYGIASYPQAEYNVNTNAWSFEKPAGTSWTFGGVQCTGWSFSFPSP